MRTWDDFIEGLEPSMRAEALEIREIARKVSEMIDRREALGWSREQLADRAGLTPKEVEDMETAPEVPDPIVMRKAAQALEHTS